MTDELIEQVARALAKSHGLDFDEVCGVDADPDNGECDSGTCIAACYEDHDAAHARAMYRADARAALAAINLPALTAWREAVIDELCSLHIYSAEHDADPRKAVRDIIEWNQRLALDPAVSAEARALHTQGWNEAIEAAADTICGLVAKHAKDAVVADVADKLGQVIRALTKENSDENS